MKFPLNHEKTLLNRNTIMMSFILMMIAGIPEVWAFDTTHGLWNKVLKNHVEDGLVDYHKLKQNSVDLDVYLKTMSKTSRSEFDQWNENSQLAFLINLYNAGTIHLILENYPIKSIKDIGFLPHAAWRKKFLFLWGAKVSLNHLEHDLIVQRAKKLPEVHFALVCAAKGCPPLRNEAYTGPNLIEQLNNQGQLFLSNSLKNRISISDNTLHLSPIFDWYSKDFERGYGSVKSFLVKRFPKIFTFNLKNYEIHYTHYDWTLNDSKE